MVNAPIIKSYDNPIIRDVIKDIKKDIPSAIQNGAKIALAECRDICDQFNNQQICLRTFLSCIDAKRHIIRRNDTLKHIPLLAAFENNVYNKKIALACSAIFMKFLLNWYTALTSLLSNIFSIPTLFSTIRSSTGLATASDVQVLLALTRSTTTRIILESRLNPLYTPYYIVKAMMYSLFDAITNFGYREREEDWKFVGELTHLNEGEMFLAMVGKNPTKMMLENISDQTPLQQMTGYAKYGLVNSIQWVSNFVSWTYSTLHVGYTPNAISRQIITDIENVREIERHIVNWLILLILFTLILYTSKSLLRYLHVKITSYYVKRC